MGCGLKMRAAMTKECEGVTVETMHPVHRVGPVFYASLPGDSETGKELLVAALWDQVLATASPPWNHCRSSSRAACQLQVVYGPLGRPCTRLGAYRGPAISFSKGGGNVWAALCGDESDIGIDVAGAADFQREYPLHRVFHPEELHHALQAVGGDAAEAAALLWSIKEAVVKALGCAFHLVDPRQINVYPAAAKTAGEDGGYTFPVGLSGKAQTRFPLAAGQTLLVRTLPRNRMWLSIAQVKRRSPGHE